MLSYFTITTHSSLNLLVKEFLKLVNIWRSQGAVEAAGHVIVARVYIEFLASFIKLSHTILLPVCSLLLADCDDTRCGVTGAVFTTIFTVVLTYIISTVAVPGPATYSMLLALCPRGATPISPPPQPVRDRLRTLGLWAPCRPVWSRDGDPGLRFVRRRGCRTGRRERKQTLSADRTCPQLSSPTPRDRLRQFICSPWMSQRPLTSAQVRRRRH